MLQRAEKITDTVKLKRGRHAPKSVIVAATGLNMSPRTLSPLVRFLMKKVHADVVQVTLNGHRKRGRMMNGEEVTKEMWIQNMIEGFRIAQVHANKFKVPVYAVGFSTGAATILAAANEGSVDYERGVYLSPSIRLRSWQQLKLNAGIAISKSRFCPNPLRLKLTRTELPKSWRSKDHIGEKPYCALQDVMTSLAEHPNTKNLNKDTLVIVNEGDMLIDPTGIRDFIDKNSLNNWEVHAIEKPEKPEKPLDKLKHVILDIQEVRERLGQFFMAG